jgi:hypothetical protein
VRPGALALHAEDRELTLIALVTGAFSRHHFAGDAVRPCLAGTMLPLGVIAILEFNKPSSCPTAPPYLMRRGKVEKNCRASSGHALHVCAAAQPRASCPCHWGGRLLCCGAGVRCALGQTRSGLGVWVVSTRGSGALKAAGIPPFMAAAQRRRLGGGHEGAYGSSRPISARRS